MSLSLVRRHEHSTRPLRVALVRLGLDFALFTSVLLAWPVLRIGRAALGRKRST